MRVVILAGGLGTRISEETVIRPKPMVEIGGRPILWHIMKSFAAHGFHEFVICCGYKGYMIKEFFANYFMHTSDVTFDLAHNRMITHQSSSEPWLVTLVDTGERTMTGGRIKRVASYLEDTTFFMTYGDGLADINLQELLSFHRRHGCLATVTAVQPPGRFGAISIEKDNRVESFQEKPTGDGMWINGGFFVLEPGILDYIDGDQTTWECEAITRIAQSGQLRAFQHNGFWQPMDTLRDKNRLEELWDSENPPWKKW